LRTPGHHHTEAELRTASSGQGGQSEYNSLFPWTLAIDSSMIEHDEDSIDACSKASSQSDSQSEIFEEDDCDNEVEENDDILEANDNIYGNRIICFDNLKMAIEETFVCHECMFRERSFATRLKLGRPTVSE
jgi:hypothetical protein